jgi:hypothetical protein
MGRHFRAFIRALLRRYGPAMVAFIGLVGTNGCEKPEPPPVAYMGPTLAAADLGLPEPVDADRNGFVILEKEPSVGRFPAGLAVVRLEQPNPLFMCGEHLFVAERGWEIATIKEEEAAYWNGLLNTVPQSRGVFVLDRSSVVSPDCDLEEVIRSVRRIDVDLCLIYGPLMVEDDAAGLAGVLVNVRTGEHVAYIQSEAGVLDFEPPRPDRSKYDRSHQDVNYLAARRFEREVRKCILELIALDRRSTATQPSPWKDSRLRMPDDSVPVYIVPNHRVGGG